MVKQDHHIAGSDQVIIGQKITRFWLDRVKPQQLYADQALQNSQRTDLADWDHDWDHGPWDRDWDNAHDPWDRNWDNEWDRSDYGRDL